MMTLYKNIGCSGGHLGGQALACKLKARRRSVTDLSRLFLFTATLPKTTVSHRRRCWCGNRLPAGRRIRSLHCPQDPESAKGRLPYRMSRSVTHHGDVR
jgi:hypothetical protein